MRFESGPQTAICLTLGTYFGCALLKSSGTVQPVEVDDHLARHTWPGGVSGSPTSLLQWHRQQHSNDEHAYGRLVGWLIGALQKHFGPLPVVLGGGGASSIHEDDVVLGINEVSGGAVDLRLEPSEQTALLGAARLWTEVMERRRPVQELIAPRS
jgi:hypothetical protein